MTVQEAIDALLKFPEPRNMEIRLEVSCRYSDKLSYIISRLGEAVLLTDGSELSKKEKGEKECGECMHYSEIPEGELALGFGGQCNLSGEGVDFWTKLCKDFKWS